MRTAPAPSIPAATSIFTPSVRVNAPDIFLRQDFMDWLDDGANMVATWHERGHYPNAYSDVFFLVEPGLQGTGVSGMPADIWTRICALVCAAYGENVTDVPAPILVRLTNLAA